MRFRPLFAYLLYNFYGGAICIKAVYSQIRTVTRSSGRYFLSPKFLIVFDFFPESGLTLRR